jgi:hypothetical protein
MSGVGVRTAAAFALAAGVLVVRDAGAQFNEPPPPAVYALSGVTVVQADGSRATNITIVVRKGFIEAMGPDLPVPEGAEVLEGDSLMVYPGMIDAQGGAKLEFPDPEVNRQTLEAWNPDRDVQGFTPHRRAADYLTSTGADLKSDRTKGIVAGAALPDGPVMPGRGAFLVYRQDAETPTELVVNPDLGPVLTLRGARGVYPATLFAVLAFHRQSLEDARHEGLELAAHERDPHNVPAPHWDPDYSELRSALSGDVPVYYAADAALDIRTVLDMAEEYGFRPIIVGGQQAWKVADRLRERGVAVLASVDFPKPLRWKPDKEAEDSAQAEPLDAAAEREKRELEAMYRNASRLAQAGVQFALTSGGGKADLLDGVRKAVEYGLDEAAALRAVTSTPASMFDVSYLTRIEPGLPATFIVTDGPLFDEASKIAYTFVEGRLEKGRPARAAAGGEAPAVNMSGDWDVSISAEGQEMGGKMTLAQEGSDFSGTMNMELGQVHITGGTVSGSNITFTLSISMGGQSMEFSVTGTVEGDSASGSGSGAMGEFTWTATRTSTPGTEVR